jgi:hypothetical protein
MVYLEDSHRWRKTKWWGLGEIETRMPDKPKNITDSAISSGS